VERWEHATNLYAKALLTAAIDARRLGHLAPLQLALLKAAAAGYLSSRDRAQPPNGWLDRAITYATEELHGATSPLIPAPGLGIGTTIGYTVADYLLQHAQARRRWVPPPASFWDAVVAHTASNDDRLSLALDAEQRGLYRYAAHLLAPAAEAGDPAAMARLAWRLEAAGRGAEAEAWWQRAAEAGDHGAMRELAEWLQEAKQHAEAERWWRRLAQRGDPDAKQALAERLEWLEPAGRGQDAQAWRRAAGAGDPGVMRQLAERLEEGGRETEAEAWWRCATEAGDPDAVGRLARSLKGAGRGEEATRLERFGIEPGGHTANPWDPPTPEPDTVQPG
jgi:TPR repeat protein